MDEILEAKLNEIFGMDSDFDLSIVDLRKNYKDMSACCRYAYADYDA